MPDKPIGSLFDPDAPWLVEYHPRPHWSQDNAIVFITIRTHDSIPREVLDRWEREKADWLEKVCGVSERNWREAVEKLDIQQRTQFKKRFNRIRETYLDTCQGACVLRHRTLAKIVAESLMHFDGKRYSMGDFIVMPNHVHLLVKFMPDVNLSEQCDSWLHFTARKINEALGRKGKFWQQEPFDHLVRSPEQYTYLREYIRNNGVNAGLPETDYLYRRHNS